MDSVHTNEDFVYTITNRNIASGIVICTKIENSDYVYFLLQK